MSKKALINIAIIASILIVVMNIVITRNDSTASSELNEEEYNKLLDDHFNEKTELKREIKELESNKKGLEEEIKKLKEAQTQTTEQQSAPPTETPKESVPQEQPKQEDSNPEPTPEQSIFINPMTNIDKATAMNKIKEQAKVDFPDDYMTQNYVRDEQSKAYDFLAAVKIDTQEQLNVINNALKDFPNDFMTAKYVYEEQMKALQQQ